MLRSMTGFVSQNLALAVDSGEDCQVTINLKSLNSRFFEVTCKLPTALSAYETEYSKLLKELLGRGQIYLTIQTSKPNLLQTQLTPDLKLVQAYLAAIQTLKQHTAITGDLTVSQLLTIPNVFNVTEAPLGTQLRDRIFTTLRTLCQALNSEREREGQALAQDLLQITARIKTHMQQIAQLFNSSFAQHKAQLQAKLAEQQKQAELNGGNVQPLPGQNPDYLHYLLDKLDIHEELTRFNDHLQQLQAVIQNSNPAKGKQLDFTLQECMREINTLSAKANHAPISALAVEIKVEIEKAREQVQNVV
ncbi:MAG TPA: YicC/YloC family endoribonuclease [Candidatus Babeliales bacterium]|nr:YicC/YloC family endoribonuclease [Candidatus Babeliales bacterium]